MAKDAATVAAEWKNRLSASTQKMTDGVNSVTVAPGQAAARQKDVYVQNVTASANKWATNVASVSLSEWQQAIISKGIPRVATGAAAAESKMQQFFTKLLPYIAAGKGSLPARGGLDQNIQRSAAWIRYMAQFKA